MTRHRKAFLAAIVLAVVDVRAAHAAQALAEKQLPDFGIALLSVDSDQNSHFRVAWRDGSAVNFELFGVIAESSEAARVIMSSYGSGRLILSAQDSNRYFIVDPHTGGLLDTFDGGGAEFSPDMRFIAFQSWRGRSNPDESAAYLLYDLALSPEQNRMGAAVRGRAGRLSPFDVGWAMYPSENRSAQTYSATASSPSSFHESRSPLFWVDGRTLAFIDYSGGLAKAVLARLGDNAHEIQVQEQIVDPAVVLDYARIEPGVPPASYLRVSWIGLISAQGGSTLRLTFPSDDLRYARWSIDIAF